MWTGSRGAFIGFAGGFALCVPLFILTLRKGNKKKWLAMGFLLVLCLLLLSTPVLMRLFSSDILNPAYGLA